MRLILLCAALGLTACRPEETLQLSGRDRQTFTASGRAIDGDTVSFNVRLFGADAYESKQMCGKEGSCWPCGKAAQDYASRLLKSAEATIRFTGQQSYGRPIGTVTVAGKDLGETMIAAGFAVPATQYLKNDPERARRYLAAYEEARESRVGGHAGTFINPALWRRGERLTCERKPQRRSRKARN